MALRDIQVSLLAHKEDGQGVSAAEFIEPLRGIEMVVETTSDRGLWQSALVVLVRLRVSDFLEEEEPAEVFFARLTADLERTASWLEQQSIDIFETFRRNGLTVVLFLNLWIDSDQMELSLPASLMRAASHLGLSIEMITND